MPDSMKSAADGIRHTLSVYDGDDEPHPDARPIGHVAVDETGYLSIVDAETDQALFLHGLVSRLNGKPFLAWVSEEPGAHETGTEPEAHFTRCASARRGQPDFMKALCHYAHRYYGVRMV